MNTPRMETYLFINPCSGQYDRGRINTVVKRLNEAGLYPVLCMVTAPEDGPSIFRTINTSSGQPLVIVAAGDGTINAVVNGLDPHAATLAVLPMGTSNVLAAEIGIQSIEEGIDRIIAGKTKSLSVGVLESEGVSRRFALMAGVGFDGAVVRDVWLPGKSFLKQGAYAIAALLSCLRWDRTLIEISTPEVRISCHSVIICNASRYGGSFRLAPDCSVFSPGLEAVCVPKNSRRTYLRLVFELFSGRLAASRSLLRIPADGCEIRGHKPIQIDGDFIGYSPARLKYLADFARIIV
jgi:diacylglycerol kinase family enzyme